MSLQGAILDTGSRDSYIAEIPAPLRPAMEMLISRISGMIRFALPTAAQLHVAEALRDKRRIDRSLLHESEKAEFDAMALLIRETFFAIYRLMPGALQSGREDLIIEYWAQSLRDELQDVLETFSPAKRVTVIGDRETLNLQALVNHGNAFPLSLELGGIITPFQDRDNHVLASLDTLESFRAFGEVHCMHGEKPEDPVDFIASGPCVRNLRFSHAPYDPKQLKDAEYRRQYSLCLLEEILRTNPDIVFLSNFKVVLDEVVPQELEKRGILLLNVHPSILPKNRGWRTEKLALDGVHPEASGYTYHLATAELDCGPVIAAQHVPLIEYDPSRATICEETQRLHTIRAQAKYTAAVLALVTSGLHQKIVQGDEAYSVEQRESLPEFPEYRRILFLHDGQWKTAEEIIGMPRSAEIQAAAPRMEYWFFVPVESADDIAMRLRLDDIIGRRNRSLVQRTQKGGVDGLLCMVDTFDAEFPARLSAIDAEMMENGEVSVRATAPRSIARV